MKTLKKTSTPISAVDAIKSLLADGSATTQEDIRVALGKQGIIVNQSKVSRLLHKIGAVKIFDRKKKAIYSLPLEPVPLAQHSSLRQLVLQIAANEAMIVIRTNPGSASLVARLLDHHRQELQILGTLAGDDTLFVVPKSTKTLQKLVTNIEKLLGNQN